MSEVTEDESDPVVARQNAESNFQRLLSGIPESVAVREEQLLAELQSLPGSAIKKLRRLHRALDELGAAISPFVACQRGCSACCHYNVHLYPIEAELIEKHAGYKKISGPHPALDFTGLPCVFLKNGQCSIYDVRPVVCRTHVALTNTAYWCEPIRSGSIPLPMAQLSQVNASLAYIVQLDRRSAISDIRQSFSAAS